MRPAIAVMVMLAGLSACAPRGVVVHWDDTPRVSMVLLRPNMLAAGDSARLRLQILDCVADLCTGRVERRRVDVWSVQPASLATVTESGGLRTFAAGRITVRVEHGDTVLSGEIEILPPVARLAFEQDTIVVYVGDVMHLEAAARDSTGAFVAAVGGRWSPTYWDRFTIQGRQPDGSYRVRAEGPGTFTASATLGHRTAEAVVIVREVRPCPPGHPLFRIRSAARRGPCR